MSFVENLILLSNGTKVVKIG